MHIAKSSPFFILIYINICIRKARTTMKKYRAVVIDGKKVIIIGNSYVYNGKMVITQSSSAYTQVSRANDKGYFYHLCKANGQEVSVTNWTFGGHGLSNMLRGLKQYSENTQARGLLNRQILRLRYRIPRRRRRLRKEHPHGF